MKLNPSPLRPSGWFEPVECFVSGTSDAVFPTIYKPKIERSIGIQGTRDLIEQLNIPDEFQPNLPTWKMWLKNIPNGYEELCSNGEPIAKLNAQIDKFYKTAIEHELDLSHVTFKVRCQI